jgi:hypothetical protein
MKVSSASITVETLERLASKGWEVVVEDGSEYVDIHKRELEEQPNANSC